MRPGLFHWGEQGMNIHARKVGNCAVLDLTKSALRQSAESVSDAVREALKDNPRKIILNMAVVEHVDSSFLADLVTSFVNVQNQGSELVLVNLQTRVRHLLELTRLIPVIEVFNDEESALAGIAGTAANGT